MEEIDTSLTVRRRRGDGVVLISAEYGKRPVSKQAGEFICISVKSRIPKQAAANTLIFLSSKSSGQRGVLDSDIKTSRHEEGRRGFGSVGRAPPRAFVMMRT